jgi:hypothetical protein
LRFEQCDYGEWDEKEHRHDEAVELDVVFGGKNPSGSLALIGSAVSRTYSNGAMRNASMRLNGAGLHISWTIAFAVELAY